jgi:KDO2-lipid IV(A) lauroyltransferase
MKRLLWLAEAFLCLAVVLPLGLLPRAVSIRIGETLGLCAFFIFRNRRRIALKNMEIVQKSGFKLPAAPEQIAKGHFINLGRSASELSMIYTGRIGIFKDIVFEGIDNYNNAQAKGKGIIAITGHCGNWELLSIANSWKSFTGSAVARRQSNPYINKWIENVRTKFGNKIIYKSGAIKEVLSTLRNGGSIGILMDQSVVENEAVITEFFGEKVYTMKIPAFLAIKTGAAVLPLFINYLGKGRHRIKFEKEVPIRISGNIEDDILVNTKIFSEYIEQYIKENPTEWLWIHRRWKLSHGRKY